MEIFIEEKRNINTISKTQSWQFWCRLCANQQGDKSNAIKISFEEKPQLSGCQKVVTSKIIEKYFYISITENDIYPKVICVGCYNFVQSVIDFSERVSKVQHIYKNISLNINDANVITEDNNEIRLQLVNKLHDLELKSSINISDNFFMDYENLEQPITPPSIVKGEPNESDELKDITLGNNVEPNCVVETIYNNNRNIHESEDEDPFSKINNDADDSNDKLYNSIKGKGGKLFRKKRTKLRELKVKQKDLPKFNIQNVIANVNCKMCDKSFQLFHLYCKHMKSNHGLNDKSKSWDCPKCGKVVSSIFHLTQHFLSHAVPCPECSKTFSTNAQLDAHIKFYHKNEKAFVCEECGTCLRTSHNLKVHMETHTDVAPFECDVCKKKWKNSVALKRHMETHSNRKYICLECGLQLKSRTTLKRHQLVHSDEMQHKCDYCGRAFKRVKALKNHLLLHTGLKPYTCDFCDRTFASGGNCRTHKKKMHPEELAALEADGRKRFTKNIPKLEVLKAIAKTSHNLTPVVTKQSGCFALRSKRKVPQPISSDKYEIPLMQQGVSTNDTNNVTMLHNVQLTTETNCAKNDQLAS